VELPISPGHSPLMEDCRRVKQLIVRTQLCETDNRGNGTARERRKYVNKFSFSRAKGILCWLVAVVREPTNDCLGAAKKSDALRFAPTYSLLNMADDPARFGSREGCLICSYSHRFRIATSLVSAPLG